ncbi:MAG: creatininase family protein [Cohaesibacter sp.]|nr:creatininase family protein [Cohaesibacter sp.]
MAVIDWRDLKRDAFEPSRMAKALVVLPIAAIEQHGPHLPVGTDAFLAEGYLAHLREVCPDDLDLIVLPLQQIGWSDEHLDQSGTLSASWKYLLPLWTDLLLCAKRCGARKAIVINSHGGNSPLMDLLMQDMRVHHKMQVSATNWLRFGLPDGLFDADEQAYGIHGGAVETSMMLHLRPDLVDMSKAGDFSSAQQRLAKEFTHLRFYGRKPMGWMASDLNQEGVVGNASLASAQAGERLIVHIVEAFVVYAREMAEFDLPALS